MRSETVTTSNQTGIRRRKQEMITKKKNQPRSWKEASRNEGMKGRRYKERRTRS